jgi:hypothetical protein
MSFCTIGFSISVLKLSIFNLVVGCWLMVFSW